MRRRVRLTESDLHRIVKESVRKILRESADPLSQDYNYKDDPREDDEDAVYDPYEEALYRRETAGRLPDGWKRIKNDDYYGGYVYIDQDGNEYERDEYGKFWPVEEPEF